MDAMNQMMDQVLKVPEPAQYAQSKSGGAAKPSKDSDSFDSMVRQKQQQQTKSQPAKKNATAEKGNAKDTSQQQDAPGNDQMAAAAAMMYQEQMVMDILVPTEEIAQVNVLETVAVQTGEQVQVQAEAGLEAVQETVVGSVQVTETVTETVTRVQTDVSRFEDMSRQTQTEDTMQVENVVRDAPVFGQVDAMPVKVAETLAEPVPLETESAVEDLAAKIEVMPLDENGNSQVELTLEPASLGKITVNITHAADGAMHIQLGATTARAANLLANHSEGLQHLLTNQSRPTVEIEVRRAPENAQQFLNPNANGQQQQGQHQQQGQQRQQQEQRSGHAESFVQQLRLGLVDMSGARVGG